MPSLNFLSVTSFSPMEIFFIAFTSIGDQPTASYRSHSLTPEGEKEQAPFTLPANSRHTIKVNDVEGVANTDLSTLVSSGKHIIAECSMCWDSPSGDAIHDSIGLSSLHASFYLPDGQTTNGRETRGAGTDTVGAFENKMPAGSESPSVVLRTL